MPNVKVEADEVRGRRIADELPLDVAARHPEPPAPSHDGGRRVDVAQDGAEHEHGAAVVLARREDEVALAHDREVVGHDHAYPLRPPDRSRLRLGTFCEGVVERPDVAEVGRVPVEARHDVGRLVGAGDHLVEVEADAGLPRFRSAADASGGQDDECDE